ncbi:hypothetical protein ABK040_002987 [Willaertia magna]
MNEEITSTTNNINNNHQHINYSINQQQHKKEEKEQQEIANTMYPVLNLSESRFSHKHHPSSHNHNNNNIEDRKKLPSTTVTPQRDLQQQQREELFDKKNIEKNTIDNKPPFFDIEIPLIDEEEEEKNALHQEERSRDVVQERILHLMMLSFPNIILEELSQIQSNNNHSHNNHSQKGIIKENISHHFENKHSIQILRKKSIDSVNSVNSEEEEEEDGLEKHLEDEESKFKQISSGKELTQFHFSNKDDVSEISNVEEEEEDNLSMTSTTSSEEEEDDEHVQNNNKLLQFESFPPVTLKELTKIVHIKQLTGGTTNRLYLITLHHQKLFVRVLVRIFGQHSENLINRNAEFHYLQEISRKYPHVAPTIYCNFRNGMVYKYFEGKGLDRVTEDNLEDLARLMKTFHLMKVEPFKEDLLETEESRMKEMIMKTPVVFIRSYKWLDLLRKNWNEFLKRGGDHYIKVLDIDKIEKEVILLEKLTRKFSLCFCHNDIGAHNIIYNELEQTYHLIDFEYCGYNIRTFDIGNFFCEYGGLDINPKAYPNKKLQEKFITAYLSFQGYSTSPVRPSKKEIEQVRIEANIMALMSNVHWSIWSMLQHLFSTIDFNYLSYAERRMTWYYLIKDDFINLLLNSEEVPITSIPNVEN